MTKEDQVKAVMKQNFRQITLSDNDQTIEELTSKLTKFMDSYSNMRSDDVQLFTNLFTDALIELQTELQTKVTEVN